MNIFPVVLFLGFWQAFFRALGTPTARDAPFFVHRRMSSSLCNVSFGEAANDAMYQTAG